jgi:hypothetical protein
MVSEGALDVMTALLCTTTSSATTTTRQQQQQSPAPAVVAYCAATLCNLTASAEARRYMLQHGTVRTLVVPLALAARCLSNTSRLHCATALHNLSTEPGAEQTLLAEALPVLNALCSHAQQQQQQQQQVMLQLCSATLRACAAVLVNIMAASDLVYTQKVRLVEMLVPLLTLLSLPCVTKHEAAANAAVVVAAALQLTRLDGVRRETLEGGGLLAGMHYYSYYHLAYTDFSKSVYTCYCDLVQKVTAASANVYRHCVVHSRDILHARYKCCYTIQTSNTN